jgi:hypothetical protein
MLESIGELDDWVAVELSGDVDDWVVVESKLVRRGLFVCFPYRG